jgi:hypothetical protein
MGTVTKTNLRDSIETFQGQEDVSNKDFYKMFYNYSVLERRRVDIAVGVLMQKISRKLKMLS